MYFSELLGNIHTSSLWLKFSPGGHRIAIALFKALVLGKNQHTLILVKILSVIVTWPFHGGKTNLFLKSCGLNDDPDGAGRPHLDQLGVRRHPLGPIL
jgi:hypothetical protein